MTQILLSVHGVVWGIPLLMLILGVGIRISVATGFVQIRLFPAALRLFVRKFRTRQEGSGVSSYRAMCTALGATVGTGNIIGVAGAVCLGGPGAVFWMWVCGLLAMATKFAEAALAVRYRIPSKDGFLGGPMYTITQALGSRWRPLGMLYAAFGVIASFGVGNAAQVNAVISGMGHVLIPNAISLPLRFRLGLGLILAVAAGSVLLGGARRIGGAAEVLVPFVSVFYLGICLFVLILRRNDLPDAFAAIIHGAFSPGAVTGGMIGSLFQTIQIGCCRGVFTNEAGMGTASIAHASAEVSHSAEQGMMGMIEVFLDTILMCSLTALVILVSGVPIPYGRDGGGTLTASAISSVCGGWASAALTAALCCFAFATILGWGLYGSRCVRFLFGDAASEPFALAQTVAVVLGAVLNTETVWLLSELFNGLMAVPNLLVLAVLTPEVTRLTKDYIKKEGGQAAEGGNHADFHQCQPLRALSHEKVPSLRGGGGSAGQENLSSEYRSA